MLSHVKQLPVERLLYIAFGILLIAPAGFFWHSWSGDAAIYFVFIKKFFSLPFEYQPGTVSYGATSPLHVVVNSIGYVAFGEAWFPNGVRALGLSAIVAGLLVTTWRRPPEAWVIAAALVATNTPLYESTLAGFETGLGFLCMALIVRALRDRKDLLAMSLCGPLYLIRPEYAISGLVVLGLLVARVKGSSERRWNPVVLGSVLALAAPVAYHLYMFSHTGDWIPTSASGRASMAFENWSVLVGFFKGIYYLFIMRGSLFFALSIVVVALLILKGRLDREDYEALLIVVPVFLLYLALPPGSRALRYAAPASAAILAVLIKHLSKPPVDWRLLAILCVTCLYYSHDEKRLRGSPASDLLDTVLLKDLARALNPRLSSGDQVAIHEVQAQYYLEARALSTDGIVGSQVYRASIKGNNTDYVALFRSQGVDYVVTINHFGYRRQYEGTLLERLYRHDVQSDVGSTYSEEGMVFEKVLTNPDFGTPGSYVESLRRGVPVRVYGSSQPGSLGESFMWNSVYRIANAKDAD